MNANAPETELVQTDAAPIKLGRISFIVVVLIIVALAAGLVPRWQRRTALRAETVELALPTVAVTTPKPGDATAGLWLPAEIKPFVESPLYARSNGYLKRWLVDIGAHVEEGQLLAEIDTPELTQQLQQARAEQAQSEAALALAKISDERWSELLKTSSVSAQEAAEKKADFNLKTANLEAARANVRRLEQLDSFSHVTAPFAGTITARNTDVGELIAAGSTKQLFRLAQTRTLRVYVRVPQAMSHGVANGQTAELTIPELPGRTFTGKVVRSSGAMSADSRTLLVELEVDNSKEEILSGSFAQVRFPEARLEAILTLPSNTLLFRAEGLQVGIVQTNNHVELRNVRLGRDFGPVVEVLDGITATDRVIVNPSDSLVGGTAVRVAAAEKSGSDK